VNNYRPRSSADDIEGFCDRAAYKVRVRGTLYLWGSAGITTDITFPSPLLLHICNEKHGEAITFGTQVAAGTQTTMGTLQPGECVSIPIQLISGVFASCDTESTVYCLINSH
jgi:hypothetical protein